MEGEGRAGKGGEVGAGDSLLYQPEEEGREGREGGREGGRGRGERLREGGREGGREGEERKGESFD